MVTEEENLPEIHRRVRNVIRVGRENATLLSDIMSVTGIQEKRYAYRVIEELIIKYGYPIVASKKGEHKGYYIPANVKEFEEASASFRASINSMKKRYEKLQENYKKKGA